MPKPAVCLCLAALLFLSSGAAAQSSTADLRKRVANLTQDMLAVRDVIGDLRMEMEDLRRQNVRLREEVRRATAGRSAQGEVLRQVDARLASLKAELLENDAATKKEIVASVSKQIDSLAAQMREALEKIADASAADPGSSPPPSFSEDYPKDGIMYLVRPGDTLSEIATAQGSRVQWIRDANKIVDVNRDLRAGETIFVPQAE
jgi:DNA repair exonuclease SbcCD ATPase subunit